MSENSFNRARNDQDRTGVSSDNHIYLSNVIKIPNHHALNTIEKCKLPLWCSYSLRSRSDCVSYCTYAHLDIHFVSDCISRIHIFEKAYLQNTCYFQPSNCSVVRAPPGRELVQHTLILLEVPRPQDTPTLGRCPWRDAPTMAAAIAVVPSSSHPPTSSLLPTASHPHPCMLNPSYLECISYFHIDISH